MFTHYSWLYRHPGWLLQNSRRERSCKPLSWAHSIGIRKASKKKKKERARAGASSPQTARWETSGKSPAQEWICCHSETYSDGNEGKLEFTGGFGSCSNRSAKMCRLQLSSFHKVHLGTMLDQKLNSTVGMYTHTHISQSASTKFKWLIPSAIWCEFC